MRIVIKTKDPIDIQADLERRKKRTVEVIYNEILKLVSAPPVSREELRFSGHPYARVVRGATPVEPVVHSNTGRLKGSIKVKRDGVVFDLDECPYIEYVREGTRTMIPRRFVREAIKNAQDELRRIWL